MLHEFIVSNREEIIRRCRAKVATRAIPSPTPAEIDYGVPVFLAQLADALRRHLISSPDIARTAVQHGHELPRRGFTVSQVVRDYGDVCQTLTEMAVEMNAPISTEDFRMLNQCLDDAIAGAVTQFGREQHQSTLDGESARRTEHAGFQAHEMRNLLNTAIVAFEVLKTGNVGVGGSSRRWSHSTDRSMPEYAHDGPAQIDTSFCFAPMTVHLVNCDEKASIGVAETAAIKVSRGAERAGLAAGACG